MKKLLFAFVLAIASLAPASADERILRFISDVQVQRNGDLHVTETIAVRAEGREIRRGILRDFPTTYHRADGSRVEVGFDVQSVTRNGLDEPYVTERLDNGVRVRIGRADQTIDVRTHEFVIRYRTTRQIGFFADFDELYWNATGTGWTFPIDMAEARITLPERVAFKQSAVYTGPQGSRAQNATVVEQQPGRIVFRTTAPLPARNGLTVAAAWPKGVVEQPTQIQQLRSMLEDDPALLYAAGGGAVMLLFYALAWLLVGRDPRRGTIIPLFAPPDGMSPAAVRYVHRMSFDDRVFAAAIIGLGVRGHIKLNGSSVAGDIRQTTGGKPIDAVEQELEKSLFAKSRKVQLDQTDHERLSQAKAKLLSALKQAYNGRLFANNFVWSGLGLLLIAAITAAVCVVYGTTYSSGAGMVAGTLIPMLPFMVGAGVIREAFSQSGRARALRLLFGPLTLVVFAAIGVAILTYNGGAGLQLLPGIITWLLAALGSLGVRWLQAPSREGRKVMDQIDGFKDYLGVAEEDRLEFLNPPEKTPELFERFLPYAIALDVQNTWAKRFAGVLATAGVGAAAVGAWYSGREHRDDPASFADRLGNQLSQTIASASTPPGSSGGSSSGGSSGSSGGGSSGGGGGGGGGSGW